MSNTITVVDMTLSNNADWRVTFNVTRQGAPFNMTGYAAKMQLRSADELDVPVASLGTADGTISISGDALSIAYPAAKARAVAAGDYLYDLLLIGNGETRRAFVGTVTVEQGLTR